MIPQAFSYLSLCRGNVRAAPSAGEPAGREDLHR